MELTEPPALRVRLAHRSDPTDVIVALRLRGLTPRGPWQGREHVVVRGQRIGPDPQPGFLVVDGRRRYSAAWL